MASGRLILAQALRCRHGDQLTAVVVERMQTMNFGLSLKSTFAIYSYI